METLKKQLMAFMNASFKTRTQAQVFVDALWEVKAEDPTKVNWALNEVLLDVSAVVMKWIDACHEECAYKDRMGKEYKASESDNAVFEVANILSNLEYRG